MGVFVVNVFGMRNARQTIPSPLRGRSTDFVPRSERVKRARAQYAASNLGWWASRRASDVCGMRAFASDRRTAWIALVGLDALETY